MTLMISALVAWLIICIFSIVPKSLSLIENIILLFVLIMGSVMLSTILSLNLKYIQINTRQSMFISYWLSRTIDLPLLLLACINFIYSRKSTLIKVASIFIALASLMLIELLNLSNDVKAYLSWNIFLHFVTTTSLLLFSMYLAKWLKRIS